MLETIRSFRGLATLLVATVGIAFSGCSKSNFAGGGEKKTVNQAPSKTKPSSSPGPQGPGPQSGPSPSGPSPSGPGPITPNTDALATPRPSPDLGTKGDDAKGGIDSLSDLLGGKPSSTTDQSSGGKKNVPTDTDSGGKKIVPTDTDSGGKKPLLPPSSTDGNVPKRPPTFPNVQPPKPTGPGGNTPLVLDYDRDGTISTVTALGGAPVAFDFFGDGKLAFVDWIGANERILALDLDADDHVTSGLELFGNGTVLADGARAMDGFAALAAYDDDADGSITAADAIFSRLLVWQDRNADGVGTPSELTPLRRAGVTSLALPRGNATPEFTRLTGYGSHIGARSRFTHVEGGGALLDVYFTSLQGEGVAP